MIKRKHKTPEGLMVEAVYKPSVNEYGHLRVKVKGCEVLVVGNIFKGDFRFDKRGNLRVNRYGHVGHFVHISARGLDALIR